jgi:AcrR family transcriptional regulator
MRSTRSGGAEPAGRHAVKTRDRILEAARQLFNEEGAGQVSTNRIAAEVGISSGNLHYHFKGKEQIVEWLFRRFELAMQPFREADTSVEALDDLWMTLHVAFETIEHHRFVYRDIEALMHEYPLIRRHAPALAVAGLEAARRVGRKLVANKVLRATPDQIDALAYHIVLTATCWYSFTKLVSSESPQATSAGFAAYQVLSLLTPYVDETSRSYLDYLRMKYLP